MMNLSIFLQMAQIFHQDLFTDMHLAQILKKEMPTILNTMIMNSEQLSIHQKKGKLVKWQGMAPRGTEWYLALMVTCNATMGVGDRKAANIASAYSLQMFCHSAHKFWLFHCLPTCARC